VLEVPRSTVTRVLARVGLPRLDLLEPVVPAQPYEWAHTRDPLHVALKRLGGMLGIGHRIHGDRRRRTRHAGYEDLHVALDNASRVTYADVMASDDAPAYAAFLQRTLAWSRRRGVTIRRLLTGHAVAYKAGVFAGVCRRWQVRQRFTQTVLREWAYRTPYRSSARRTAALRLYLRVYHHRRPSTSLGQR